MPTVVVLGANSFSGADFVDLILRQGKYEVVGVSRSSGRSPAFLYYYDTDNRPKWKFYQLNLNEEMPLVLALLERCRPEYVVNFAAQSEVAPSWETPEDWFQTNCVALAKMVNHMRKQTYLRKYLHVSSPEVYGDTTGWVGGAGEKYTWLRPSTPYAASKAAADMLLECYRRQYGFPLVTVRSTNVYGPRQQLWKIIPRTIIAVKQGRKIQLHGGGKAVKSYIHVRDVSRGELAILERGRGGEVFHLSPDRGISVVEVVTLIADVMGKSLSDVAEVVPERPGQDAAYVIDSTKARTELGWKPGVCFTDGLAETIAWVEENWREIEKQPLEYSHRP